MIFDPETPTSNAANPLWLYQYRGVLHNPDKDVSSIPSKKHKIFHFHAIIIPR